MHLLQCQQAKGNSDIFINELTNTPGISSVSPHTNYLYMLFLKPPFHFPFTAKALGRAVNAYFFCREYLCAQQCLQGRNAFSIVIQE